MPEYRVVLRDMYGDTRYMVQRKVLWWWQDYLEFGCHSKDEAVALIKKWQAAKADDGKVVWTE